jgi:hypothetical protein
VIDRSILSERISTLKSLPVRYCMVDDRGGRSAGPTLKRKTEGPFFTLHQSLDRAHVSAEDYPNPKELEGQCE